MLKRIYQVFTLISVLFILAPLAARAEGQPLPAEQAFVFSANLEKPGQLVVQWHIAPGYYLYRDKLRFSAEPAKGIDTGTIAWPASQVHRGPTDEHFRAYTGHLQITLPLNGKAARDVEVTVRYQGCSEGGFCYAPMKKQLHLRYPFSAEGLHQAPLLTLSEAAPPAPVATEETDLLNDQGAAQAFLASHGLWVTLLCFLGLGLLLAFTPCSLPMIPILSSIIVGRKNLTPWKAFQYSLAYVLGMALTYAVAGLLVAWLGSGVQAYFQNPWVITAFSALFVVLALSSLNWFELQLPSAWRSRILGWQQRQQGGSIVGDFLMGCLSTLVVSPCVTAPLVGVLAYISETGNLVLGGGALFALGLGMGLPLLLLGLSAGKYLPKSGPWMNALQKLFAYLLLGMAIWMMSRILADGVTLFLWASLLMVVAMALMFAEGIRGLKQALVYLGGGLCILYSMVLFVGVAIEANGPWYPFERMAQMHNAAEGPLPFIELKDMSHLETLLAQARREGKPVVLDYYAEWCESCKALEASVLSQKTVQDTLKRFVLIRANVTENNAFDQALLKRYHVIAPPTFLFFNPQGREIMEKRIVGEVDHRKFIARANGI